MTPKQWFEQNLRGGGGGVEEVLGGSDRGDKYTLGNDDSRESFVAKRLELEATLSCRDTAEQGPDNVSVGGLGGGEGVHAGCRWVKSFFQNAMPSRSFSCEDCHPFKAHSRVQLGTGYTCFVNASVSASVHPNAR